MVTTGMDLKLRRVRERITSTALAERGGWKSHARVSQIESMAVVPRDTAERYLTALATFSDVITTEQAG